MLALILEEPNLIQERVNLLLVCDSLFAPLNLESDYFLLHRELLLELGDAQALPLGLGQPRCAKRASKPLLGLADGESSEECRIQVWLLLRNGGHLSRGSVPLCEDVVVGVDRVQDPDHPVGVGRELPQPLDRPLHGRLDILAQVICSFHVGTNCVRTHVGQVSYGRFRRNLPQLALVHLRQPVRSLPHAVHESERHQPRLHPKPHPLCSKFEMNII